MLTRWSTHCLPNRRRLEFWREAVSSAFVEMTPTWLGREAFLATIDRQTIGELALNRVTAQPHGLERGLRELSAPHAPTIFVNCYLDGTGVMSHFGRKINVNAGRIAFWDSTEPCKLDHSCDADFLSLSVPQKALGRSLQDAREAMARDSAYSETLTRLLAAEMRVLASFVVDLDATEASIIACTLTDLICTIVAPRGQIERINGCVMRRARAEIEQGYGDPDLTPSVVAARLGISKRVLHAHFAAQHATFMETLYSFRLEQARSVLARKKAGVAEVAEASGFRSAAHFARRFKQSYGVTPATIRM